MATTRQRKRHRILALAAAVAVAVLVAVVVAAVVVWLRQPESQPTAVPPSIVPPSPTSPVRRTVSGSHARTSRTPAARTSKCCRFPGTWESSLQLDPLNPVQFPVGAAAQRDQPDPCRVRHRPGGRVDGALHRAVPQSVRGGQADVVQRQPRRGHQCRRRGTSPT